MDRDQINHQGSDPLNGNDAYAVLGIVFDWMLEQNDSPSGHEELLNRLREAGYCACTTEFGCVACGGK